MTSVPKYIEIADTLRAEIQSDKYPVGTKLQPETQLCKRFGVSRFTIREAIKKLAIEKFVKTERGAGTTVINLLPQDSFTHTYTSLKDLTQYAQETWLEIKSVEDKVDIRALQPKLAFLDNVSLARIISLRKIANGKIIALVESYVEVAEIDYVLEIINKGGPIYAGLESKLGISINRVQQETFALQASRPTAEMLKVKIGDPILGILRSYYFGGKIRLASFNKHYSQDSYRYVTNIRLNNKN